MSIRFLYCYIVNPEKALKIFINRTPVIECSIILLFLSLSQAAQAVNINLSQKIILLPLIFITLFTYVFVQSIIFDFIAQLFKLKAQSLKLFSWLGITYSPFLIVISGNLISGAYPSFSFISEIISLMAFILFISLQLVTIKQIYETSMSKSILIFLFPVAIFGLLFSAILFFFVFFLLGAGNFLW